MNQNPFITDGVAMLQIGRMMVAKELEMAVHSEFNDEKMKITL